MYFKTIVSPLGYLILGSSESALKQIRFSDVPAIDSEEIPGILLTAEKQLQEYFLAERFEFDLNIEPEGTEFSKKVWDLVSSVPFGETTTYNEIAIKLGSSTFNRAVGLANGKNPIPVIIPCHRVVGANGKLVGYAGGLDRKRKLLLHEMAHYSSGRLF
jgi:methylated-DNA-[protein]-cysteine S-methyltransferase